MVEASLYLCSAGARKQPRPYVQRRTEIKDDPPHGPDVTRESTFYITISRAMASAARIPSWHEAGCSRDSGQGDFRLPVFGRRARRSVPPAFSSTVWSAYIAFLCAKRTWTGPIYPRPGASLPRHGRSVYPKTRSVASVARSDAFLHDPGRTSCDFIPACMRSSSGL